MKNYSNNSVVIFEALNKKYEKSTLSKSELASELGIGLSTLNKYLAQGIGLPNYIKLGTSVNSRVLFNISDVAEFLVDTVKVAWCLSSLDIH